MGEKAEMMMQSKIYLVTVVVGWVEKLERGSLMLQVSGKVPPCTVTWEKVNSLWRRLCHNHRRKFLEDRMGARRRPGIEGIDTSQNLEDEG